MKIPGLDGLVRWATLGAHRLGLLPTAARWTPEDLDCARGILIVVSTALGDSVCSTPLLDGLRRRFPHVRLVGLYHAAFASMYRDDPRMDEVIPYYGKYRRVAETVQALRRAHCDVAVLAYIAEPDVIPLVRLGGARILFRMIGRDTAYRRLMANPEALSRPQTAEHAVCRSLRMLEYLGGIPRTQAPTLHVDDASRARVALWLEGRGVARSHIRIGIHVGASAWNKRWPVDCHAEVGRGLLAQDPAARLILTGAAGERPLVHDLAVQIGQPGRVIEAAGAVGVEDLPGLVASLGLFISADTGVAHVAYAVGTPSVTLFWRSDPAISGPIHDIDRHRVLARQPLCPPCRPRTCVYPACAVEIPPDRVLELALSLLDRSVVDGAGRTRS